jgi:hypothetical protein
LLGDPARAAELARAGPERAALFSWERTAQAVWESYGRAVAGDA